MTDADFLSITHSGRLCDDEGGLGEHAFELIMREQVARPGPVGFPGLISEEWSRALACSPVVRLGPGPLSLSLSLGFHVRSEEWSRAVR